MIGIYKITTKHNNKIYIGSSDNINKRIAAHLSRLRRNAHHSAYLQAVYNKYGKENLEISIIEILIDNKDKIKKEQYWLDLYQSYDRKFGYNMSKNASCNTTGEKKAYQYDLEGNFIKEWESINKAQQTLNLCSISAAMNDKNSHNLSGGFQWKYYKKDKIKSLLKLYCCYNLNGEFVKYFYSENEIKSYFNINNSNHLNIARSVKTNKSSCDHLWKIYNTYDFPKKINSYIKRTVAKEVLKFDKNGNLLETFKSLTEAAKSMNVKTENLHRAVSSNNPKYKTCKGFVWKYL